MGKYAEHNLLKSEEMVQEAEKNKLFLLGTWITELVLTNRRMIGKTGVLNTRSLDAPLDKIQNVAAEQKLLGKIFNYGTVTVHTAAGVFSFDCIKDADAFKNRIMAQIDQYEKDRIEQQAKQMAQAMTGAIR